MRYLVTGGAGFIGGHLCEALLDRGDAVLALDNLATGNARNLETCTEHSNFQLELGSVMDDVLVDELVRSCDVVVHLAAAVGVKLIVSEPLRSLRTNIRGAETVFEACHRYRRKVFVASTSEVYGKNDGVLHEDADRILGSSAKARWAYSTSKAVDEILAFAYWRERQLPTVVARFFNTVGPRQTGAYGMVIPRFVAQALTGQTLTIYGDGTQTRTFCDVTDVVRAVLGLLDHPDAVGNVYNIGGTEEVTINELAERILRETGSQAGVRHVAYEDVYGDQYEDTLRRVPDTTKLRGLIDWGPRHTLDAIVKRTIDYAQDIGPENLLA